MDNGIDMKSGSDVQSAPVWEGNDTDERVAFRQKQQLEVKSNPLVKVRGC